MLDQITPLILTHNESPNIAQSLSHINWAKDIVVVVQSNRPRFDQNYMAAHFQERLVKPISLAEVKATGFDCIRRTSLSYRKALECGGPTPLCYLLGGIIVVTRLILIVEPALQLLEPKTNKAASGRRTPKGLSRF